MDLQPSTRQRAGDGLGVDAVWQVKLLPELLTSVGVGALLVLLLLLRLAAHPQLSAHLFHRQLLRRELFGIQAECEAVAVLPQLLEGNGFEDGGGGSLVNLLKNLLVQPLHELHVLPHLLHVAHHLLFHVVDEWPGLRPQAADRPVRVQERPHGDWGRLEYAGAQHTAGAGLVSDKVLRLKSVCVSV